MTANVLNVIRIVSQFRTKQINIVNNVMFSSVLSTIVPLKMEKFVYVINVYQVMYNKTQKLLVRNVILPKLPIVNVLVGIQKVQQYLRVCAINANPVMSLNRKTNNPAKSVNLEKY